MEPLFIGLFACAVWVYVDARKHERDLGQRVGNNGALGWAAGTVLLWIVFFPWYLFARSTVSGQVSNDVSPVPYPYQQRSPNAPAQSPTLGAQPHPGAQPVNQGATRYCTSCGASGAASFCPTCGASQDL